MQKAGVRDAREESPAALVRLSEAARRGSLARPGPAALSGGSSTERAKAERLRELVSKLDFHSITPRQLAKLGSTLFEAEELSADATSALIGIENSLVTPMNADEPIDMYAHFERLVRDVSQNTAEPGSANGLRYRQGGLDALNDITSFATSDRLHVQDLR
jgi:hypothetical protein